jgi:hypothetical protein
MEYKTIRKFEVYDTMGIEIRIALKREITEADELAARKACDELQEALEFETARLDPDVAMERELIRLKLLGLFEGTVIWAEEIPNGYCSRPCCSQKPWYVVTTKKGRITLGWRKRVIEISWDPTVADMAQILFPDEDVTKIGRSIHAWGYEKAKQYIQRLLA